MKPWEKASLGICGHTPPPPAPVPRARRSATAGGTERQQETDLGRRTGPSPFPRTALLSGAEGARAGRRLWGAAGKLPDRPEQEAGLRQSTEHTVWRSESVSSCMVSAFSSLSIPKSISNNSPQSKLITHKTGSSLQIRCVSRPGVFSPQCPSPAILRVCSQLFHSSLALPTAGCPGQAFFVFSFFGLLPKWHQVASPGQVSRFSISCV